MDALLWVVIAIFVAFMIVAVTFIMKAFNRTKKSSEIHISGGANIEKGYLSNDNNYFKGGYSGVDETVIIGKDYRTVSDLSITMKFTNLKTGQTDVIIINSQIILGRVSAQGCYTVSEDSSISKAHCRIYISGGKVYVEDLNSRNHTYVNSNRLNPVGQLNSGDILKIGKTKLKVTF